MTQILWIIYHKLLIQAELPKLRNIGYEVFSATYLPNTYDQRAVMKHGINPTAIPEDVQQLLRITNFCYHKIPNKVVKIYLAKIFFKLTVENLMVGRAVFDPSMKIPKASQNRKKSREIEKL